MIGVGHYDSSENTGLSTRLRRMSHFCLGRHVAQRPGTTKMAAWKKSGTLKSHLPEPRLLDATHIVMDADEQLGQQRHCRAEVVGWC